MKNSVKNATLLSYITLSLGSFISIIYTPFMLSKLGSAQFGIFSLVNTIIAYLFLLDMGLGNAVIRYNSKALTEKDEEKLNSINGLFLTLYTFITILAIFVFFIFYFNINNIFHNGLSISIVNQLKDMLLVALVNVIFALPLSVFNGIIIANEKFLFIKIVNLVRTIFNPIVMSCVLFLGYNAIEMLIASTVMNLFLGLSNLIYCFKVLKIKFKFNFDNKPLIKEIFNYSFYVFLSIIGYRIFFSSDQFILGMFLGAVPIAIFAISSQLNNYFASFLNVINGLFLPKLTKLLPNYKNNKEVLMEILIRLSRIQFFIFSFLLLAFILIGKPFIIRWAGEGFIKAYTISLIILIPQLFTIIQSLFATLLDAMNRLKIKSLIYLGIAILNIVLSLILVNIWGLLGCAVGTAICIIINAVLNNLYYHYKIKLNMGYYWKKMLTLILPTIVTLFLGLLLNTILSPETYLQIGLFVLSFGTIYMTVFWLFGFNEYEKKMLISIFPFMNSLK